MFSIVSFSELRSSDLIPGEIYEAGKTGSFFKDEVISNIFKFNNLKGIGNQSGIRRTLIEKNPSLKTEDAFVVLLDTKSNPEWPNEYNRSTKILKYYGDNQDPKKEYLDTKQKGNVAFEKYYHRCYSDSTGHIAPFLYFERINGRDARFIGIAVPYVKELPKDKALELKQFIKPGEGSYDNYVAYFTVLEVPVPRQWLYDLKVGNYNSEYTPTPWYNFLKFRDISSNNDFYIRFPNPKTTTPVNNTGYRMTTYRKTQSQFRSLLLKRETGCQICNLSIPSLLIASHIIPWAIADETQKIDLNNGLLLCISHDALFDKGFISFDENGKIIISNELPRLEFERLQIHEQMSITIIPEQEHYLQIHRKAMRSH